MKIVYATLVGIALIVAAGLAYNQALQQRRLQVAAEEAAAPGVDGPSTPPPTEEELVARVLELDREIAQNQRRMDEFNRKQREFQNSLDATERMLKDAAAHPVMKLTGIPANERVFTQWKNRAPSREKTAAAEISADQVRGIASGIGDIQTKGRHGKITLDRVVMLTPEGLYFQSDADVTLVPFTELPDALVALTGWTSDMPEIYLREKKAGS